MRNIIATLIVTITICVTCTSCFTTMAVLSTQGKGNDISREKAYLSLKIFQTLNKNEALAFTDEYDVVKIQTTSDVYYDGKQIDGNFILVGTYTYEAKNNFVKTVPVYVLIKEYKQHQYLWK